MPSEGSDSSEIEPSSFVKVKAKVFSSTRKANHAALHRAWTLYYITTGTLFGVLAVSVISSIFMSFNVSQTSELGFVLICIIMESVYIIGHGSLTWFRTHALCLTGMIINFGICCYMFIFIVLIAVQDEGLQNPLENMIGFAFVLTVMHSLSFLADLNLLRFLHFKNHHWIGRRLFGGFARKKQIQQDPPSPPELPEYSMTVREDSTEDASVDIVQTAVTTNRVTAGIDVAPTSPEYPNDINPFSDEDEDVTLPKSIVPKENVLRTDPFNTDYALSEVSSDGPASEYLIDCQDIIPEPTNVFTDFDYPPTRGFGTNRMNQNRQTVRKTSFCTPVKSRKRQMEYIAEIENQWTSPTYSPETVRPTLQYPVKNPSVLVQKSILPVPEYTERADFISRLPETAFY